ncbi:hypothetical protein FRB91_000939 [Serendipita sp. 411]|nr:hypothetical protein FRB91_000939 [Serendipita sp. 411]
MGSILQKMEEKRRYSLPEMFYPLTLHQDEENIQGKELTMHKDLPPLPAMKLPSAVDSADTNTPDNWVKRVSRAPVLKSRY